MSNKLKDRLLGKTANLADKVASMPRQSIADQAPVTMPGQLGAFRLEAQKYLEQIQQLKIELEKARRENPPSNIEIKKLQYELDEINKKIGKPLTLPIENLIPSPLQTRKLDLFRVKELAEHLSNNDLTTPIVVRPFNNEIDKFEIIAGHHRVEAFKHLRRIEIEAIIRPMSDEEALKRIFFDNLMAPDLPDFEKYKGFSAIRKRTGQSYSALAEDAGINKSTIGRYFAFERFPQAALEILDSHPEILGSNAAQDIASINPDEEKLISGLQKIISGELDQKRIIAFLKQDHPHKEKSEKAKQEDIIKCGEHTVCTLQNKNNKTFTLTFHKGFDSHDWHKKLSSFIEKESSIQQLTN